MSWFRRPASSGKNELQSDSGTEGRFAFAREKRRLLAWLGLLTPLPLPFNELLAWAALAVWIIVLVRYLRLVERDALKPWPEWLANVLAIAYLPFLWFDFRVLSGGRVVGPLVHLVLFALAVKLHRLQSDRDRGQIFLGLATVFLAAMGTSVHPTVVLYLLAWIALAVWIVIRFLYLNALTEFGHRDRVPAPLPLRGFVTAVTVLTALVAIPLFILLPRSRVPFVIGRGSPASANVVSVASFSDEVTLDAIGRVRGNRTIALRAAFDPPLAPEDEARFKAGVFDRFDGRSWTRPPVSEGRFERTGPSGFALVPGAQALDERVVRRATIWRQALDSTSLPIPVESLRLEAPVIPGIRIDGGGVPQLAGRPADTFTYATAMAAVPTSGAGSPSAADFEAPSAAIAAIARQALGSDSMAPAATIARLERFLLDSFDYTLEFESAASPNPIEDFLLRTRRGNCELFASSLVLLLRAEGVPARLVTGFLGGEENPIEGYLVVRQDNAHAWVEAWDGAAWIVADPTPPEGRPLATRTGGWTYFASQAWDFVMFRWDRYVLTYGAADQQMVAQRVFDAIVEWWRSWRRERSGAVAPSPDLATGTLPGEQSSTAATDERPIEPWMLASLALAVLLVSVAAGAAWRRARAAAGDPVRAYRELRQVIASQVRPARTPLGPLAVLEHLAPQGADVVAPARRIVEAYVARSFGGEARVGAAGSWTPDLRAVLLALRASRDRERAALRRGETTPAT